RLISAALLIWLGLQDAPLASAVVVSVLAWATDMLDGWAARHATTPTRLAPYDFAIDTVLYGGILAYLTLVHYLPVLGVLSFAVLAVIASLVFQGKAVKILAVRLIDLACAVVVFIHEPMLGWLIVLWLAVMTLVYRRRLAERVPLWLAELARLAGKRDRV
ncbi:MAG TPA: hypothetical protein VGA61_16760, partial [Anaerolineae bacterium]